MRLVVVFLIGCLLGSAPLLAAPIPNSTYKYFGWEIDAYSNGQTGQFSHCTASIAYNSGNILVFLFDQSGWRLGIINMSWTMPSNARYPVTVWVDRNQPMLLTATAVTPQFAVAPLESSAYLFELFKGGSLLNVVSGTLRMGFNLNHSRQVLDATIGCAQSYINAESSHQAVSDHRAETIANLANDLAYAHISDFQIAPDKPSGVFADWDVSWRAPHLSGFARIDQTLTVEQATAVITAKESAACHRTFGSVKNTDGSGIILRLACEEPTTTAHAVYSVTHRAAGGSYVSVIFDPDDVLTQRQTPPRASAAPRSEDVKDPSDRNQPDLFGLR
jgi:hypothetical protein